MATIKQSFLSKLLGRNTYNYFKKISRIIVLVYTIILIVLFWMSSFCYWSFFSWIFSIFTGTSLFFVLFVITMVVLFDFEVDVEEAEKYNYHTNKTKELPKPLRYKFTIIWGIVLIALGVISIVYTNKYRHHVTFRSDTFLVDERMGIYHVDFDNDCEYKTGSYHLIKMKGYQIEQKTDYTFCELCDEWLEKESDFPDGGGIYKRE